MDPRSFDINAPSRINPSPNSRPVIVGHRPIMTDPMMRPVQTNTSAQTPAAPHVSKVIQVSDELRNDLAAAQPAPAAAEPALNTPPGATPAPLGLQPTAATTTTLAPTAPTPQAAPAVPVYAPEQDISHLPHVPIAHHHHQHGKVKNMVLWTLVGGFLLIFAAYLLIDAGLIGSSANLPFHIFHQTA